MLKRKEGVRKMKDYKIIEQIGETGMSSLYYAVKESDNQTSLSYFMKKYDDIVSGEMIKNEILISQTIEETCSSSVIIPVLEGFHQDDERYVIMQFRKNGLFLNTIIEKLENQYGIGRIPLNIILELTMCILESLSIFHEYEYKGEEKGYLHLDLNPGNIFFESVELENLTWGKVKFIDLGSSVPCKDKEYVLSRRNWYCCSDRYSSREIRENMIPHICKGTDMYSVCGCMMRMIVGPSFSSIEDRLVENLGKQFDPVIGFLLNTLIENASCDPSYYRYQKADEMKKDINILLKCLSWVNTGKYYDLLYCCYERSFPIGELLRTDRIIQEEGIMEALSQLKEDLEKDDINYGRCQYIFENIYKISKQYYIEDRNIKKSLLVCGLSCYNNTGQTTKAVKLYEDYFPKLEELSIEEYVTMQLRYAVSVADCYEFEKAYDIVFTMIQGIEAFKKVSHVSMRTGMIELGRAYSAAGTYLAFLKKEDPMKWYKKALEEFKGDEGNSQITYSKILHYAVDIGDRKLYEYYAEIYFGKFGFKPDGEVFQLLTETDRYSAYALFIYLKGINRFYWEDADQKFFDKLAGFLMTNSYFRKDHPEQLILKYGALLLYKHGDKKKAERLFSKALTWIEQGRIQKNSPMNIMMLMSYQTCWIANELEGKDNQQLLRDVISQCEKYSWNSLKEKIATEQSLGCILNHEYC